MTARSLCLALLSLQSLDASGQNERWYQDNYCNGMIEVTMPDRSRCDCLTATHAIEYEFANKWKNAIGQSLNYAFQSNKRAGIALILRGESDYKYWIQLNSVIDHYKLPIDTTKISNPKRR